MVSFQLAIPRNNTLPLGSLIREAVPPATVGKVEGTLVIKSKAAKWQAYNEMNYKQEAISRKAMK